MTELRNALRSIEWDLQDIRETCSLQSVIDTDRKRLSQAELRTRFDFVNTTDAYVQSIRDQMASSDQRFKNRSVSCCMRRKINYSRRICSAAMIRRRPSAVAVDHTITPG